MVHLVWAIGGVLDCLRAGQIEQARARLNIAILQADQASIDRGNWLLSQQLSLEVGPPMSSFKKHEIASSSSDPVYSRLLDARWAVQAPRRGRLHGAPPNAKNSATDCRLPPRTLPKLLPTTPTSLRESRTGGPIPRTMHEPSWCSAGSRLRSPCTVASSFVEFNTPLVFGPFCFVLACRAVPEDESLSHALHVAVPNGLWQQLRRSLKKAVDQSFGGPVVL